MNIKVTLKDGTEKVIVGDAFTVEGVWEEINHKKSLGYDYTMNYPGATFRPQDVDNVEYKK